MKFSSVAAPEVVKITISSAADDKNLTQNDVSISEFILCMYDIWYGYLS